MREQIFYGLATIAFIFCSGIVINALASEQQVLNQVGVSSPVKP